MGNCVKIPDLSNAELRLSHLDFDTMLIALQITRSVLPRQELAHGELR